MACRRIRLREGGRAFGSARAMLGHVDNVCRYAELMRGELRAMSAAISAQREELEVEERVRRGELELERLECRARLEEEKQELEWCRQEFEVEKLSHRDALEQERMRRLEEKAMMARLLRSTVCQVEASTPCSMASGLREARLCRSESGAAFPDLSPTSFVPLIEDLHQRQVVAPGERAESSADVPDSAKTEFERMANSFMEEFGGVRSACSKQCLPQPQDRAPDSPRAELRRAAQCVGTAQFGGPAQCLHCSGQERLRLVPCCAAHFCLACLQRMVDEAQCLCESTLRCSSCKSLWDPIQLARIIADSAAD